MVRRSAGEMVARGRDAHRFPSSSADRHGGSLIANVRNTNQGLGRAGGRCLPEPTRVAAGGLVTLKRNGLEGVRIRIGYGVDRRYLFEEVVEDLPLPVGRDACRVEDRLE